MKSIELVIKYYKTSGLDIPQPIQELIDEITRLSPCEQEGYLKEIKRLRGNLSTIRKIIQSVNTKKIDKRTGIDTILILAQEP